MNQSNQPKINTQNEENVLFGIVGAFLFSLAGGVLYVILNMIGYIAAISGLVGVVCAIKGYAFFAKKESTRGVIISVIIAAVVLVIAWYVGFCLDLAEAYEIWHAEGEVDYVPNVFECMSFGYIYLPDNPAYFADLAISLVLAAVGCGSYVYKMLKKPKEVPVEAAPEAAVETTAEDTPVEPTTEEAPAGEGEDTIGH